MKPNPIYRPLDPQAFAAAGMKFESNAGELPKLDYIAIEKLVIDPSYQRAILEKGKRNVRRIATEFRWSHFEPVVVAPTGDGRFAIINGQHRATGAALRGLKKVPCAIVTAGRAEQAAAFAAINGNVTAVTPMQIYHAAVAANDPVASAIDKVCRAAGVNVCRYAMGVEHMKPGDTFAAGALKMTYSRFGGPVLQTALACITETGGGNPGLVRAQLIKALCVVLADAPKWRGHKNLFASVERLGLRALWQEAEKRSAGGKRTIIEVLINTLRAHFAAELGNPT